MVVPEIIYGTAWKEDNTAGLVKKAVATGYRAIDSANQKKHYREDFVGAALRELFDGGMKREELWLQSKFTYARGQDHRLPYDPQAPIPEQVRASFESSLKQLHTDYLDSFVLHSPSGMEGLVDDDWRTWGELERLKREGKTRAIGVSNIGLGQLAELHLKAKEKPDVVQNRCFAARGWDRGVREYCRQHAIAYQGFSLLTANPQTVQSPRVGALADRLGATREQVVFALARRLGILPLTGTSDPAHMAEDLAALRLELSSDDVKLFA
ncbi:MAG: aldo/keto reductase [Elusimicrobia bacterium]|nr:aldo/keto reductase [Elusimicrobiota bacterium]